MKLDQLRKIIREEVRAAVKEELQDVMNEAVKYASTPLETVQTNNAYAPVKQKDISRTWSTGRMNPGTVPLEEMIADTRRSMTAEDVNNIIGGGGVKKPNFAQSMATQMTMENSGPMPGIDITKLDFVSKAKSVLDAANKKDKNRIG